MALPLSKVVALMVALQAMAELFLAIVAKNKPRLVHKFLTGGAWQKPIRRAPTDRRHISTGGKIRASERAEI